MGPRSKPQASPLGWRLFHLSSWGCWWPSLITASPCLVSSPMGLPSSPPPCRRHSPHWKGFSQAGGPHLVHCRTPGYPLPAPPEPESHKVTFPWLGGALAAERPFAKLGGSAVSVWSPAVLFPSPPSPCLQTQVPSISFWAPPRVPFPPQPPGKICLSRPRLSLKPPILLHVFPLHFVHLFLFLLYLSPKFTDLKLLIACFYLALEIKGLMNFSLGNFLILADSQKCDAAIANASDGGIWR